MIDFGVWLDTQGNARCLLVELDYMDAGVSKTAYFASAAFVSAPTDTPANTAYDPFIVGASSFERSLNEVFTGRSVSRASDIELVYQPSAELLLTKAVYGQQMRIYMGDKRWHKSDFQQIIAGICDGVVPEQSTIKIKFRDAADSLKKPLLTERYASGSAAGQLKPLTLGRCFNIKPVLIDDAAHVYQFSTGPSAAVTAVRFNGALVSDTNYTVDLANSTVTFNTYPIGDITMDVDGVLSGFTWLQTGTQFIEHIAYLMGISVSISGLPAYQLGLYITEDTHVADILDDICASVGGYWFYSRLGQFNVRAFSGIQYPPQPFSRSQIVAKTLRIKRVIHPLHSITLQYKRNWTPLSNIAASVYETTPALAAELSATGKSKTVTQDILAQYPQAGSINVESLIVSESDAATEIDRRLALAAIPRFVYEMQALASPFGWTVGDTAFLQNFGINGDHCVITKLTEQLRSGRCQLEVWQ